MKPCSWSLILLLVPTAAPAQPAASSGERVSCTLQYTLTPSEKTTKARFDVIVPRNWPERQRILSVKYSIPPEEEFERDETKYARFELADFRRQLVLTIEVTAEIYPFDLKTAQAKAGQLVAMPLESLKPYLASEKWLESDGEQVRQAAEEIPGGAALETVRHVSDYVKRTLRYDGFSPADRGAAWALKQRRGDCTEFGDLFVALCRAKGIPARHCEGYLTVWPKGDTPKHSWAEAYLPEHGWVRFDPIQVRARNATFESLPPRYLHLTHMRNNPMTPDGHYFAWRWWGGSITVRDEFTVTKREKLSVVSGP